MRESANLEFKSEVSNAFLKTVSAYANFRDGSILFGVDDDGVAIGVDDVSQACLSIENKINDGTRPTGGATAQRSRSTESSLIG